MSGLNNMLCNVKYGTGDDMEMKELHDADSSADEPTEESTNKSDPGVVDLVRRAVPLALTPEDDPRRDEQKKLQEKKEEIDMLAHKQVQRILWSGLGLAIMQVGLFFRLTFLEFSWDVMEPIAFFTTTTGLVIGFAYFLFTFERPNLPMMKMSTKSRLLNCQLHSNYNLLILNICKYFMWCPIRLIFKHRKGHIGFLKPMK
ncbi:hypothetical protein LOK49_LG06G02342 [Camellia lanceoleosa]|uniref:Uncharacterized protein n=1 Tax=Camellia lanceoleosa TaxID=1840588 RepID=A0ACC0HGI1_9ERIC|nr:hypothetical protein LOK49_LG06G02342 [Camellia lanceoleosa]